MIRSPLLSLVAPLLLAAPAAAQQEESLAQSSQPPQRTSVLYTYGDDPCPIAEGDEIVVCAQQPESERYRVPKALRGQDEEVSVGGGSWASAVEGYDNVARQTRPNSCSPIGSYGFTGCTSLALREWFEARRTTKP